MPLSIFSIPFNPTTFISLALYQSFSEVISEHGNPEQFVLFPRGDWFIPLPWRPNRRKHRYGAGMRLVGPGAVVGDGRGEPCDHVIWSRRWRTRESLASSCLLGKNTSSLYMSLFWADICKLWANWMINTKHGGANLDSCLEGNIATYVTLSLQCTYFTEEIYEALHICMHEVFQVNTNNFLDCQAHCTAGRVEKFVWRDLMLTQVILEMSSQISFLVCT